MLYCESCYLHVCGSCLLTSSYDHSLNCPDVLRYMRNNEKHPQYVPDSKDSSTISDSVQTPTDKDSVVPIWQDGESLIVIESLMNSLQKRLSATVRGCALAGLSCDHDPGGC